MGHESFGEVLTAPVGSGFAPGDLVVGIVRRPDPVPCPACAGENGTCAETTASASEASSAFMGTEVSNGALSPSSLFSYRRNSANSEFCRARVGARQSVGQVDYISKRAFFVRGKD